MQQPSTLAKPRISDFIRSASKIGIRIGLIAAACYLSLISLLLSPSLIGNYLSKDPVRIGAFFNEFVITLLIVWGYGIGIGLLPTLLFGGLTGALLGALVYKTHKTLPKVAIISIAYLICMVIIVGVAVLITQGGYLQRNWFLWYFIPPAVIYILIAGPATAKIYDQLESNQQEL